MQVRALSHKEFLRIDRNYEKAARAVNLVYVSDAQPGIARVKKGKGFAYTLHNKTIREKEVMERIRSLVIPPAWTHVWICALTNGHIQATGLDVRQRKQYRYHPLWSVLRNETKFHRLYEFGKTLVDLRARLEEDMKGSELTENRVIAAVISVMERTYIRVGNEGYEKMYGSHGLTTLKDKHVNVNGDKIRFSFTGKKGVQHDVTLRNRRLARIVQQCRDIPGKELFQYYDAGGSRKSIDSGMINAYIKAATGQDFTSKDFRTWAGSLNLLRAFRSIGEAATATDRKKNVVAALDQVSLQLGNTRTVCKKYYVHPGLIELYEQDNLHKYLRELDELEKPDDITGLTTEEQILMKILHSFHK